MTNDSLTKAEADFAALLATMKQCLMSLDKHAEQGRELREVAAAHLAKSQAHDAKAHALHETLAEVRRRFGEGQETLLKQLVIHASGAVVRLHALNPIEYDGIVTAAAEKIRTAIRGGTDTVGGQPDPLHNLVRKAIALAPVVNEMQQPVYELGATVHGVTDWPTRRERLIPEIRRLLADLNKLLAKISPPLEAA
jgi:hypothetical protein